MPFNDLTSRLTFDGTSFERGANRAKAKVSELERTFASVAGNLRSGFLSLFSFEAARRLAKAISEDVDKIQELADKFNITTDEVQLLQAQAKATGRTFDELIDKGGRIAAALREARQAGRGTLYDPETIRDIQRAQKAGTFTLGESKALGARFFSNMLQHPSLGIAAMTAFTTRYTKRLNQAARMVGQRFGVNVPDLFGGQIETSKRGRNEGPVQDTLSDSVMGAQVQYALDFYKKHQSTFERMAEMNATANDRARKLGLNIESDSLRSVGNFLGGNTDPALTLMEINEQVREILEEARRQREKIDPVLKL